MTVLPDLLLGLWITVVATTVFLLIPAIALGRAAGRPGWGAEAAAGLVWTALTMILVVPALASLRLLTWVTAVLLAVAWPTLLWLYRYRGAPLGEFRAMCRALTLRMLSGEWRMTADLARPTFVMAVAGAIGAVFLRASQELRLQSPAEYSVLASTRTLLDGGEWIFDPVASLAAVLALLSATDPMQVIRFLHPLALVACVAGLAFFHACVAPGRATPSAVLVVAAGLGVLATSAALSSTGMVLASAAAIGAAALSAAALQGIHRRDRRHVAAALVLAATLWGTLDAKRATVAGHLEYDAAARVAREISTRFDGSSWMIAAPPEQALQVETHRYVSLAALVGQHHGRAGERSFRIPGPAAHLFVFVEKQPLAVSPAVAAALATVHAADLDYHRPNARARLQRAALELCERYRGTHAGASVYYEDENLRVYRFDGSPR